MSDWGKAYLSLGKDTEDANMDKITAADVALAVVIGVLLAAALVHWWAA